MEEQLVSFETAVLAKEKGFDIRCLNFYFEDGELRENVFRDTFGYYGDSFIVEFEELIEDWNDKFRTNKKGDRCFGCKSAAYLGTFSAPFQSLLQKWLREEHKIIVDIWLNTGPINSYRIKVQRFEDEVLFGSMGKGWKEYYNGSFPVKDEKYVLNVKRYPDDSRYKVPTYTYEEALEIGLREGLITIKKKK